MKLKDVATRDKLRGGYYTPKKLANFIVEWGFYNHSVTKVLEPSCGDGVFLSSLKEKVKSSDFFCKAIELDKEEANKSSFLVKENQNFCVINNDFYYEYRNNLKEPFDLIVGNPPYIRYQYLTEEQREEQSIILTSNQMKSNKLINAWVSFVVACVSMLDKNGRIGLIIPAELLQVAYAEDLRKYLMIHLQRIEVITFRTLVFPEVEQEVVVLLGEKDSSHNEEHKIRILEFDDIDDLINKYSTVSEPFQNIEMNNSKWIKYFLSSEENALIEQIKNSNAFVRFGKIAQVDVGITTGNNNYFCVSKDVIEKYHLEEEIINETGEELHVLRPLIARSVSIRGLRYTEEDVRYNLDKGKKAYLLAYPGDVDKSKYPKGHNQYIELGEKNKENTGYKCSIRRQWYSIPSVWVPDAFFLRRNHLYPKFILNTEINAVSTDTMHRIKFNEGIKRERAILAYYNSISFAFTEIEARSYGGGVLEILPREVENIYLSNIFVQNSISDNQVLELLDEIELLFRKEVDIEEILDIIDKKILIEILGLNKEKINVFRGIWHKLKNRRLNRGKK